MPTIEVPHGIVGFFGKRGSGKSLGMTTYARRRKLNWRRFIMRTVIRDVIWQVIRQVFR